jgi:deoxyribonuclease V
MKPVTGHDWQVSLTEARQIQERLAARVSHRNHVRDVHFVAGIDVAAGRKAGLATAAVVVLSYPWIAAVEIEVVKGELNYPYIPGFLSFRELPLALRACEKLATIPDLLIVDGQGIAHPRRLGLASHLGLLISRPTIGCAKSPLCGTFSVPDSPAGSYSEVVENGETIAVALRTKNGVKPVFVSVGHKVSLSAARKWVLDCCRGYRLPEPTRLAHLAAGGNLPLSNNITHPL